MPDPGEVIFWGAGGHAKVLRECLQVEAVRLVALFDNDPAVVPPFGDVPVHTGMAGFEDWLARRKGAPPAGFLVAIGGEKGRERVEIQEYLESRGQKPLVARHRTAFVAEGCAIGAGSQVLARAAVCVGVSMGRGCIVNTSASVDHECCLGDGVHVGPGATLAGCVEVGRFSMIGAGAVVLPRIRIGEGAVVGAGAVVTAPVEPHSVVVGNPARVLRRIQA